MTPMDRRTRDDLDRHLTEPPDDAGPLDAAQAAGRPIRRPDPPINYTRDTLLPVIAAALVDMGYSERTARDARLIAEALFAVADGDAAGALAGAADADAPGAITGLVSLVLTVDDRHRAAVEHYADVALDEHGSTGGSIPAAAVIALADGLRDYVEDDVDEATAYEAALARTASAHALAGVDWTKIARCWLEIRAALIRQQ